MIVNALYIRNTCTVFRIDKLMICRKTSLLVQTPAQRYMAVGPGLFNPGDICSLRSILI